MNIFFAADGGFNPTMWILLAGVWIFILVIPMRREKKKKAEMMDTLKKGDKLLFNSGLVAKLVENKGDTLIVDSHNSKFEILTNTLVKVIDQK